MNVGSYSLKPCIIQNTNNKFFIPGPKWALLSVTVTNYGAVLSEHSCLPTIFMMTMMLTLLCFAQVMH